MKATGIVTFTFMKYFRTDTLPATWIWISFFLSTAICSYLIGPVLSLFGCYLTPNSCVTLIELISLSLSLLICKMKLIFDLHTWHVSEEKLFVSLKRLQK